MWSIDGFKAAYGAAQTYLGAAELRNAHAAGLAALRKSDPHAYQALMAWCKKQDKFKIVEPS